LTAFSTRHLITCNTRDTTGKGVIYTPERITPECQLSVVSEIFNGECDTMVDVTVNDL